MTGLPNRLRRDRRGAALIEFAFGLPLFLLLGGYGVETANLAITNMRVSQIALTLADNASRIGVNNGQQTYQLREGDLNDILKGAWLMGAGLKLTTYGRVTISSLENVQRNYYDGTSDPQPIQRLHWQRCIGAMSGYPASNTPTKPVYDSSYGQATPLTTAATDTTQANAGPLSAGMGVTPVVTAPSGGGVIFVEINYQYQPIFGTMFAKKALIHYVASFIVRDRRDFNQIYNPAATLGTPTRSTCDLHNAAPPTL